MSIGYILLWLVGISTLSLVLRNLQRKRVGRGWSIAGITVLAVAGLATVQIGADAAGYIALLAWVVLILIPAWGKRICDAWCTRGKFRQAYFLSLVLRVLHPFSGYPELPKFFRALNLWRQGNREPAETLSRHWLSQTEISADILPEVFLFLATQAKWEDISALLHRHREVSFHQGPLTAFFPLYLRTLAETGNLRELINQFQLHEWTQAGHPPSPTSLLFIFAFTGMPEATRHVLTKNPLLCPNPEYHDFWLATAHLTSGNKEAALALLQKLQNSPDARLQAAVQRRLCVPLATHQSLDEADRTFLNIEVTKALNPSPTPKAKLATPWVTRILVGFLIFVFALENYFGGSESEFVLLMMGALRLYNVVVMDQWWRLFTATLLHAGIAHIAMNCFALSMVGPLVERTLGSFSFLILYVMSGIGSSLGVTLLGYYGIIESQFLVGASGAIMGLIGATAAIFLKQWHWSRKRFARDQLQSILFAMAIQVVFDLSTPQVSFSAHISGLIPGFILGLLLYSKKRFEKLD